LSRVEKRGAILTIKSEGLVGAVNPQIEVVQILKRNGSFRAYMKRAELVFKAALVVCVTAWAVQAAQSPQYKPRQTILDESDIDRLEKELADPVTRLPAIAALADFGGMKLYRVGSVLTSDSDAKRDALRERAAKLALMCNDINTISRALDSDALVS
jgi:hypothetical protein